MTYSPSRDLIKKALAENARVGGDMDNAASLVLRNLLTVFNFVPNDEPSA